MDTPKVKTVGKRRPNPRPSWQEIDGFLRLMQATRKCPHLVPKGVVRFRSFEEAQTWMETETIKTLKQNPTVADLIHVARLLNDERCRYVVLGGMAINHCGIIRATADIDLMVEDSVDNMTRVIRALARLPDHAALELTPEEIRW